MSADAHDPTLESETPNEKAQPPAASDVSPGVSRLWVVLGSLAVLLGLAMGFVMSSLGK